MGRGCYSLRVRCSPGTLHPSELLFPGKLYALEDVLFFHTKHPLRTSFPKGLECPRGSSRTLIGHSESLTFRGDSGPSGLGWLGIGL